MSYEPFIRADESARGNISTRVPVPLATKKELLTTLAIRLSFPDYFGGNWEALEECLRDLSWLSVERVGLIHADIPLLDDVANARTYLSILRGAVEKTSDSCSLSVVFPSEFRVQIE